MDGLEQTAGRRRLMRNDENVGRVRHLLTSGD
jgi:hypothetical protein